MTRTYGSLKLDRSRKEWTLDIEPHVAIRVRRMFPRAVERHGAVRLKDAQDVCRDIVWLLDRYPLNVSLDDRAYLEQRAAEHDALSEIAGNLMTGTLEPRAFDLALPARDYQRVAADLILRTRGLLVADSVGLGKTITYICTLTDPDTRPALVVTMTHLPKQWQRAINRFAPNLTTHVLKKGTPYPLKPVDVIITSYSKLAGWADALSQTVRSVVFDECQELRHSTSQKYIGAETIARATVYRTGLSATPVYNYGNEFHNVINVIRPDALGSRDEFLREWCGAVMDEHGKAKIKDPAAFGTYLRDQCLMIRRSRADVQRELPPLTKIVEVVNSDAKVFDAVQGTAAELAKFLLAKQGTQHERMQASGELDWRLRQATGLAKAAYVADFVSLLVESGEKVVLFGWHHAVYDVWEERLTAAGCKVVRYTGEQSASQKEAARIAFVEGDANVIMMSLRSGAGLDGLQHVCSTVVFGELDWSPATHEQCTGRVFRDEQQLPVTEYFLVSEDGSDPVMSDVLGIKRGQIYGVIDLGVPIPVLTDTDRIRRLAESFLKRQGIQVHTQVQEGDIL